MAQTILWTQKDGSGFGLRDVNGKERVGMLAEKRAVGLTISDTNERVAAAIGLKVDGTAYRIP